MRDGGTSLNGAEESPDRTDLTQPVVEDRVHALVAEDFQAIAEKKSCQARDTHDH
jgi:hypothetical protein